MAEISNGPQGQKPHDSDRQKVERLADELGLDSTRLEWGRGDETRPGHIQVKLPPDIPPPQRTEPFTLGTEPSDPKVDRTREYAPPNHPDRIDADVSAAGNMIREAARDASKHIRKLAEDVMTEAKQVNVDCECFIKEILDAGELHATNVERTLSAFKNTMRSIGEERAKIANMIIQNTQGAKNDDTNI